MREFIMYSSKGATTPEFFLKDLPGSGGRMDLVARCVISALWLSRDMRRDSRIVFSLNGPPDPPLAISFDGGELERVSPDERNISIWIKKTLKQRKDVGEDWLETHKGIQISRKSFWNLLEERKDKNLYILQEEGDDIREVKPRGEDIFVLGDHIGLPENGKFAEKFGAKRISVGPESYFSSQSISIVHNELDRRGV